MSIEYKLDTKELDRILKNMPAKRSKIIRKTAFKIEERAKKLAPVALGALMNSIFTKTEKSSGYGDAVTGARESNPDVNFIPESEFPVPEGGAIIGAAVEYAVFVELGTSRMATRPFLSVAGEMTRNDFENELKELTE